MKRYVLILLMMTTLLGVAGCGMTDRLMGSSSAGTVPELWADVPPLDGAQKADLQLPLAARLGLQTMLKSAGDGSSMDFIAFTAAKTPADVQAFYNKERMQSAGWTTDTMPGCTGENSGGKADAGTFCLFGKSEQGKDTLLAIVVTQDDKTSQTQVFYTRISTNNKATPTP